MKTRALKAALPHCLPVCAGFLFIGMSYGVYMSSLGFSFVWPMVMSVAIFAGSMEFLTANLLVLNFDPLNALLLALTVNARHLFYGISMLDKYRAAGKKKWYLIYGMCDESFAINASAEPPQGVDRGWFMFFVTLINQCAWVGGATLGGLVGGLIPFDTTGIDFVLTALFVVIFLGQWQGTKQHLPALAGVLCSVLALLLFGADRFILPAMILILLALTALRGKLEKKEESAL
ncbi:AzlC family ABC transporter permease [Anaerofilum sp. BX8]|uniref:AzlC family ABC transporter permease n=1 Tax=Anaerofilum hominis TaxID=2763016 RepID=A0A923KY95_9FIRM|nr:AzlC family ABC transporter permease [Anaerofilum hominis]MBC5581709.1 AzlC family ABC transporter permease [Anaerofilum hominis]